MLRNKAFLTAVLVYLIFALLSLFSGAVSAQQVYYINFIEKSCNTYNNPSCFPEVTDAQVLVEGPWEEGVGRRIRVCNLTYQAIPFIGYIGSKCAYALACPDGKSWRDDGAVASCQSDNVATPQECGITGFPVWNGNGYTCEANFNTSCPEGTVNGMYTMPGFDPRPYCADANPPTSSSSADNQSSDGQQSSSASSSGDGNGDGSGSSSSSSAGSGSGSSGSSSSGQGGNASSAGAGECDPTSSEYLDCLTPSGGMPDHTETGSGAQSFSDVNGDFLDGLMGTGIMEGMSGMANAIQLQSASCPVMEMDLSNTPIGRSLSTDIHCVIWAEVNDPLEIVMYAVWLFAAFRIFASA